MGSLCISGVGFTKEMGTLQMNQLITVVWIRTLAFGSLSKMSLTVLHHLLLFWWKEFFFLSLILISLCKTTALPSPNRNLSEFGH